MRAMEELVQNIGSMKYLFCLSVFKQATEDNQPANCIFPVRETIRKS